MNTEYTHTIQKDFSTIEQCPKYQKCNAPICPIDPKWKIRKHISGDRICFYLLEAQKPNAKAVFEVRSLRYLHEAMVRHAPEVASTFSIIEKAMDRAKTTSSRMEIKIGGAHGK